MLDQPEEHKEREEAPPMFGSWKAVYWFVALFFFVEVAVFYLFTKIYS